MKNGLCLAKTVGVVLLILGFSAAVHQKSVAVSFGLAHFVADSMIDSWNHGTLLDTICGHLAWNGTRELSDMFQADENRCPETSGFSKGAKHRTSFFSDTKPLSTATGGRLYYWSGGNAASLSQLKEPFYIRNRVILT